MTTKTINKTITKITNANGFRAMAALRKAAADPRIDEIEGGGCDDGRVFLHARKGLVFQGYDSATKSVGSAYELRYALSILVETPKTYDELQNELCEQVHAELAEIIELAQTAKRCVGSDPCTDALASIATALANAVRANHRIVRDDITTKEAR